MLDDLSSYKDLYAHPSTEDRPFSVTDLTLQIKGLLESSFGTIWVRGELSNFKYAPSGHAYFSLKDQNTVISAALFGWKKMLQSSEDLRSLELKDGVEVLCRARISVYAPRGSYQIIVDRIEVFGKGSLQDQFEKLKLKLEAQGLFDVKHKKKLPLYPKKIAVITSPSGAALQDVIQVLKRRAPMIEIFVIPVLVQGATAAEEMVKALETIHLHKEKFDMVLLTRGGGSQEDLWCFNHEALAVALFNCELPLLSAVGHEIDFTIADFVADVRAPTPSAGAEILSFHWVEVIERLNDSVHKLHLLMENRMQSYFNKLQNLFMNLVSPREKLYEAIQRCDEYQLRLETAMKRKFEQCEALWNLNLSHLHALSPLRVLERGYTIVQYMGTESSSDSKTEDSVSEVLSQNKNMDKIHIIKSSEEFIRGKKYTLQFYDGKRKVQAL